MASLQMIDPYYYYKDLNIPDPQGRAEALYLYSSNPALWYEKVVLGKDITALAQQVTRSTGVIPPVSPVAPETPAMIPSPVDTTNIATQPSGGQNMIQKAMGGIKKLFGR